MEIIVHIFHISAKSSRESHKNLCLVASWARHLTLPYMYRRAITHYPGSTNRLLDTISKEPTLGHMVDSLCINEANRPSPHQISQCCPNLHKIIGHNPAMTLLNIPSINHIGIIIEEAIDLRYATQVINSMVLPSLLEPSLHQFIIIYRNDSDMERMLDTLKQGRAVNSKLTWVAINEEDGRSLQAMWDGNHLQGDSIWEIAEARTKAIMDPSSNA